MAVGSGIGASLGFGAESTVGTAVTPDHFAEFNSETVSYNKTVLQGMGLRAGGLVARSGRRKVSRKSASGTVEMDLAYNKLGLLLQTGMGSGSLATPTLISGSAYKQIHTIGSTLGKSLTVQIGRPQTDGTVVPFTVNGCKVTKLSISVTDGDLMKLSVDVDGWNVTTATSLAAPSYVSNGVFSFADSNVATLGGTVTTTTGVASVSGGAAIASMIKGFTLDIEQGLATERYGLGNAGIKKEQVPNDYIKVSGSLDTEFTSRVELYDLFAADTQTAIHFGFQGALIAGSNYNSIDFLIPAAFFDTGAPQVGGPDIVGQSITFAGLDDGTNNPCQITLTNTDAAI
jgi:tail tube protein